MIRHGESEANAGQPTESAHSISLTERGHAQAGAVVAALPVAPDLIVVSSYVRARQTAEPTIATYPSARVEEWPVEEFTYLSLKNALPTTAADRRPFVEEYWRRCDPNYCDGEGAESFADFISRVNTTIDRLSAVNERSIVLFSHGQFIRAIMRLALTGAEGHSQQSMREFDLFLQAVPFPNAAFVVMHLEGPVITLGQITTLGRHRL